MQASGLRRWRALGFAVALISTAAIGASASQAAGPANALSAPVGETSLEFVGRIHQEGASFAGYGYLTHLAGVPDASLFSDPNLRDESHARFTFVANTSLTSRSVLDTLFVLNTAGDTRFYFQANPKRQPTDAASFAKGVQIGSFAGRIHNVINVQSANTGVATTTESLVQKQSAAFTLGGKQYRFGRVGLKQRLSAVGEGKRSSVSPLSSDIIIAGDAVTTS
jgi:hypothetical protein